MAIPEDQKVSITRALIPDTELVFGSASDETMFSDTEIGYFILAGGGSVLRGAALANMAIATSEALISKKIKTQDLQTDGPAVADSLIKKANILFARADKEDQAELDSYFDIIDYSEGWGNYPPELTEWNWGTIR